MTESLTDATREAIRTDAMLHPAPDLPKLRTRPFNDTVLALCKEAGLTLFTLEAFDGGGSLGDKQDLVERASALGVSELNRQCLCLLFIVGYPDVKGMLKAVRSPDFYDQVITWSIDLPDDPDRMAGIFTEWQRYMLHTAASLVKVLPKDDGSGPTPPPNS